MFALDTSSSLNAYRMFAAISMIMDVVRSLPVGEHEMHIGFVTYSSTAKVELGLTDSYDTNTILNTIWGAEYRGGVSCAANAMAEIIAHFASSGTPGNSKVLVYVTEGPDSFVPEDVFELSNDLKLTADVYAVRKCAIISRNSPDRQCMTRSFPCRHNNSVF